MKLCIKCGSEGHANRTCTQPVTSYGVLLYKYAKEGECSGRLHPFVQSDCKTHGNAENFERTVCRQNEILFYLVERKDTIGFLNIVQGNYDENKLSYALDQLTCEERCKIRNLPYENLWGIAGNRKKDIQRCCHKFSQVNWASVFDMFPCKHREGDYVIPKGRLQFHESIMHCAVREFSEESGYPEDAIELLRFNPYEETFVGTDSKLYRNVYFVGRLKENAQVTVHLGDDLAQSKEVRNMGWFTVQECKALLRDYHEEKKLIIDDLYAQLTYMPSEPLVYSEWIARTSSYDKIERYIRTKN